MKNRASRSLAIALAVAVHGLSSCMFFGGSYDLDVRSAENTASQLQSLYLIVSPKPVVQEQLASPAQYGELLEEDRVQKYMSFSQYEPLDDGSWKLVHQGRQSGFVVTEIDEKSIEVEVDHELIEKSSMSELCLVVLAFFGSEGFEQVTVEHAVLDAEASQIVEVGAGSLDLRDK
jgi:hypothetical protein